MSNQAAFEAVNAQLQTVINPFANFGSLVAKNMETLSKMQLETLTAYSELSNENLQSLVAIKQPQDLANHGSKQLEIISKVSQRLLEDGQKLSEIGNEFKAAVDEISATSINAAKSK
ncbi:MULTISPECIES: phasin family protein [Vibrio]|uniref:Phasin family protein n=1 Tax=Vibrio qingdaonensis TaxID=2829491 RepID=A0A9X3CNM5_9VIBR|nr:phasin family protein [Vibrio qingdaonensis]MCW8346799.1 phasin family protein [Vibrio qingdaonensis]